MNGPSPDDARRAAKTAGLLASDKDGEVVAAARALVGILGRNGLDPQTVVAAGLVRDGGRVGQMVPHPVSRPHWRVRARMAALCPHITDWERQFLGHVVGYQTLSARQESTLKAIIRKSEGVSL